MKTVYTIGHSTRTIEEFVELLKINQIELLIDIRHFPGSRKFPQFNKEVLPKELEPYEIEYFHMISLGGRQKIHKDSKNTRWHKDAFRSYADYMETPEFKIAIHELEELALHKRCAFMCAEAVWWRCHRSMVSDYLKAKGWKVLHILSKSNLQEHPYTSAARVIGDEVVYYD